MSPAATTVIMLVVGYGGLVLMIRSFFPKPKSHRVCPTCGAVMFYQPVVSSGAWTCNTCKFMSFR